MGFEIFSIVCDFCDFFWGLSGRLMRGEARGVGIMILALVYGIFVSRR